MASAEAPDTLTCLALSAPPGPLPMPPMHPPPPWPSAAPASFPAPPLSSEPSGPASAGGTMSPMSPPQKASLSSSHPRPAPSIGQADAATGGAAPPFPFEGDLWTRGPPSRRPASSGAACRLPASSASAGPRCIWYSKLPGWAELRRRPRAGWGSRDEGGGCWVVARGRWRCLEVLVLALAIPELGRGWADAAGKVGLGPAAAAAAAVKVARVAVAAASAGSSAASVAVAPSPPTPPQTPVAAAPLEVLRAGPADDAAPPPPPWRRTQLDTLARPGGSRTGTRR